MNIKNVDDNEIQRKIQQEEYNFKVIQIFSLVFLGMFSLPIIMISISALSTNSLLSFAPMVIIIIFLSFLATKIIKAFKQRKVFIQSLMDNSKKKYIIVDKIIDKTTRRTRGKHKTTLYYALLEKTNIKVKINSDTYLNIRKGENILILTNLDYNTILNKPQEIEDNYIYIDYNSEYTGYKYTLIDFR